MIYFLGYVLFYKYHVQEIKKFRNHAYDLLKLLSETNRKRCPAVRSEGKSVRNSPANTKVREEGGGGSAPGAGAERDSPAARGEDHGEAGCPPAA